MSEKFSFDVKKKRPEEIYSHPSDYFKGEILEQYATSKSIMKIQERITIRALEILKLNDKDRFILDAGTGPGFAAMYLNEIGYKTVAIDIITEFLNYYDIKDLNPIASDMCFPPFRPNVFDAIISISSLQWIYREINNNSMKDQIINLAKYFHLILKPKKKVIFQFYPKNKSILDSIGKIFLRETGFSGYFIIDNPKSPKKRKIFLILEKV
ncbi:MAG: class I SAM-dependent methyltransferase [Candidatus Hermodarchaeota archaeon]